MSEPAGTSGGGQQQGRSLGKWVALAPAVLIVVAMGAIGYHHATRNKIRHAPGSLSAQRLYEMYCARCHMADLRGQGANPGVLERDLTLAEVQEVVLHGRSPEGRAAMPAFKDMDPADVQLLHAFIAERRAAAR